MANDDIGLEAELLQSGSPVCAYDLRTPHRRVQFARRDMRFRRRTLSGSRIWNCSHAGVPIGVWLGDEHQVMLFGRDEGDGRGAGTVQESSGGRTGISREPRLNRLDQRDFRPAPADLELTGARLRQGECGLRCRLSTLARAPAWDTRRSPPPRRGLIVT